MPLNDQDARALTYIVRRLRDETYGANAWDENGVHVVIAKLVGRNLPITVEQITRHASDPDAKTPGAITRPFVPEAPKPTPGERPQPPRAVEACPDHPGYRRENCGGCYADQRAAHDQADAVRGRSARETALAAARQAHTAAVSALCPHRLHADTCALCKADARRAEATPPPTPDGANR